ncbi:MAG: pentapeptide repeat-containing protein [Chloroflexi bacterium]|nr:pentapeptide repeat-containing protein [Chloroflexota bacterium]
MTWQKLALAVIAILLAAGLVLGTMYTAGWMFRDSSESGEDQGKATAIALDWGDRLERVATAALLTGGVAALAIATWRGVAADQQAKAALTQTRSSERRLLDERYQEGAEMLGDTRLVVRLAGVYALDRLLEDDKQRYYADVMSLFSTFLRFPIPADRDSEDGVLRADLQTVLLTISRRNDPDDVERLPEAVRTNRAALLHEGGPVNLLSADLRHAFLLFGRVNRVMFVGANLSNCNAWHTDFTGAIFLSAIVRDGSFLECDLTEVEFNGADLTGCSMAGSKLDRAVLRSANLSGVKFSEDGKDPVTGLTQRQLDRAIASPYDLPFLEGVMESETCEPLVWRGRPWFGLKSSSRPKPPVDVELLEF